MNVLEQALEMGSSMEVEFYCVRSMDKRNRRPRIKIEVQIVVWTW